MCLIQLYEEVCTCSVSLQCGLGTYTTLIYQAVCMNEMQPKVTVQQAIATLNMNHRETSLPDSCGQCYRCSRKSR